MALNSAQKEKLQAKVLNAKGQSTIEFILTLILLLAFVLFYFQLSMIYAFGNYVHYATFMAARAYLSAGPDSQDQEERAKSYLAGMVKRSESQVGVDKFPTLAKGSGDGGASGITGGEIGPGSEYQQGDINLSWMMGVRYTFKSKLFMIPLSGVGKKGPGNANSVKLTSESWLGQEPSDYDCRSYMGSKKAIFDNGC